jgi:hypothetical protein
VLICSAGAPVARMRSASKLVCWSPSMTATGTRALQGFDGAHQQARLARAGAGDQVQRENSAILAASWRLRRRVAVVLGEDVLLYLHHPAWLRPGTSAPAGPCP